MTHPSQRCSDGRRSTLSSNILRWSSRKLTVGGQLLLKQIKFSDPSYSLDTVACTQNDLGPSYDQ